MTKTLYVNEFLFLLAIKGKALPNHPQPVNHSTKTCRFVET